MWADPRAPRFTVVDVFAGGGGLSEGFRQAGYSVIAGADSDPDAMATYTLNFPEARAITGDIRDPATKEQVLAAARCATVLIGGPPCQAFSQVRNHTRMMDDPRNALYREFVWLLRETLPQAFLMENVTGMDQMRVRDQIVADLSLEGEYAVLPQVLDAADFGVPQTRKRLFFIGIRASSGIAPPQVSGSGATGSVSLVRSPALRQARYRLVGIAPGNGLSDPECLTAVTAAQAISDLASLPMGNRRDRIPYREVGEPIGAYQRLMRAGSEGWLTNVQVPRINRDTELRLGGIPQGGNHRDLDDDLLDRYITGQRWGRDNGTGRLSRRHFYAYRRLHPDIWAWTLNTKADSVYHYERSRALSVREFARLQSFPDRFVFTTDSRRGMIAGRHDGGPGHSRYRQVGNAVPPLLAKSVAKSLMLALDPFCAREAPRSRTGIGR
ncbi:MAG: DNA cytosine methyltransferase [Alphaproteobacteria bacterium]|nr:DNA cytosine methyltransferase [Alphaproteobacteria bacterium]